MTHNQPSPLDLLPFFGNPGPLRIVSPKLLSPLAEFSAPPSFSGPSCFETSRLQLIHLEGCPDRVNTVGFISTATKTTGHTSFPSLAFFFSPSGLVILGLNAASWFLTISSSVPDFEYEVVSVLMESLSCESSRGRNWYEVWWMKWIEKRLMDKIYGLDGTCFEGRDRRAGEVP